MFTKGGGAVLALQQHQLPRARKQSPDTDLRHVVGRDDHLDQSDAQDLCQDFENTGAGLLHLIGARFSRPMEAWSRCSPAEQVTTDSCGLARSGSIRLYHRPLIL